LRPGQRRMSRKARRAIVSGPRVRLSRAQSSTMGLAQRRRTVSLPCSQRLHWTESWRHVATATRVGENTMEGARLRLRWAPPAPMNRPFRSGRRSN
jgi:hypothetical protein